MDWSRGMGGAEMRTIGELIASALTAPEDAAVADRVRSGVLGLSRDFVDTVPTPLGVFSGPLLLFVRMAFLEERPVLAGSLALLLLVTVVFAGSRTVRLMLERPPTSWIKPGVGPRIQRP